MGKLYVVYTSGDVYIFDEKDYKEHGNKFTLYKVAHTEEEANKYAEEACYI